MKVQVYCQIALILASSFVVVPHLQGQIKFQNLNFEEANVTGYAQGSDNVPIAKAMPGWNAFYSNVQTGPQPTSLIGYDGISTGGNIIDVNDANFQGFIPLQGSYTAYLFGGALDAATINQTGLVPIGTKSLEVDIQSYGSPFIVTLDGVALDMIPLQTSGAFTLYGADISSFAGQTETLSFTSRIATSIPPNFLELDNIVFSPNATPEPATWALMLLCGAGAFAFKTWRRKL